MNHCNQRIFLHLDRDLDYQKVFRATTKSLQLYLLPCLGKCMERALCCFLKHRGNQNRHEQFFIVELKFGFGQYGRRLGSAWTDDDGEKGGERAMST